MRGVYEATNSNGYDCRRAKLLVDIQDTWTALNAALDCLTEASMTMPQDAQGWTIDHHLIHLTFWARSVVFFFWGQPCHQCLGIEKALYLKRSIDEIRAAICQKHKDLPLSETLAQFRHAHHGLPFQTHHAPNLESFQSSFGLHYG